MTHNAGKLRLLLVVPGIILLLDRITKWIVQSRFALYEQVDVLGSVIRLTYIHNPGAAFGLYLGPWSRQIFLVLSAVAIAVLAALYWFTPAAERARLLAIALIGGGALGNFIDRLRSARGVVDFVDVGFGTLRWPVFNVADMAVTTGAIVLALSLWREDRRLERVA
jgi:signal peptidase II